MWHSKSILFIIEYFKPHVGWAETLFDNVIAWLLQKGYTITVLTSKYTDTLAKHEHMHYHEHTIDVYRVGHNRYDFMRYALFAGYSLIKKHKIDIIQTATFNGAIPSWILKVLTKTPTILHVHEVYRSLRYTFFGRKWFFYKLFESLIFLFSFDYYTCSSLYTKNSLRLIFGIPDAKLITTYCGIDYKLRDSTTVDGQTIDFLRKKYDLTDKYVWLYFGRPGIAKWLCDYLKAIPEIIKTIPHFVAFLIVPKTEKSKTGIIRSTIASNEVLTLINDLDIHDHVIRIDSVEYRELKNYIRMSDTIVLPTMAEWFGIAIAEVCALHKPLVTTNVWSVPEVVGWTVALVEAANPQDIARWVIDIYQGKWESISTKRFLWDDCVEKFILVYKKL